MFSKTTKNIFRSLRKKGKGNMSLIKIQISTNPNATIQEVILVPYLTAEVY
jgi:hypothetical protein